MVTVQMARVAAKLARALRRPLRSLSDFTVVALCVRLRQQVGP